MLLFCIIFKLFLVTLEFWMFSLCKGHMVNLISRIEVIGFHNSLRGSFLCFPTVDCFLESSRIDVFNLGILGSFIRLFLPFSSYVQVNGWRANFLLFLHILSVLPCLPTSVWVCYTCSMERKVGGFCKIKVTALRRLWIYYEVRGRYGAVSFRMAFLLIHLILQRVTFHCGVRTSLAVKIVNWPSEDNL